MSARVAVIDYGMGNLRSVEKGFEKMGVDAFVTGDAKEVAAADGVVLPGVGAFADAIAHLRETGLAEAAMAAIDSGRPFLGICLGLQLLFERSFENGEHEGLGVFGGNVEKLTGDVKIPHMGWNQLHKQKDLEVLTEVPEGTDFYFVHSYVVKPTQPEVIAVTTDYAGEFVSGVARDNVVAFQFHPEKSGLVGLSILKSFGEICAREST